MIPREQGEVFYTTWSILAGTNRNLLFLPSPQTASRFVCTTESSSESSLEMRGREGGSMKGVGREACLASCKSVSVEPGASNNNHELPAGYIVLTK